MTLKFRWETKFQETEIGEIPIKWKICEVQDVIDKNINYAIVDGPFGTQLHMHEYTDFGIPVVRVSNLSFDGTFSEADLVYISREKFKKIIEQSL